MSAPLDSILGIGAIVGGFGYAAGSFLTSRRRGIGESLQTALGEIQAERSRGDRLESEMHRMAQDMAELRAENVTLRNLLTGGQPLLDALERTKREVEDFARTEHERTRALIEQIRGGE